MRTPPARRPARIGLLALVAGGALALLYGTAGGSRARQAAPTARAAASAWRGLVGVPRAPVALGQRVIVVLRAPSLADHVAGVGGRASDVAERRWTVAALAAQQQLVSRLAAKGIAIRPDFRYVRVVNGFSAAL